MLKLDLMLSNDQARGAADGLRLMQRVVAAEMSKGRMSSRKEEMLTRMHAAASALLVPLDAHFAACAAADAAERQRSRPAGRSPSTEGGARSS